MVNCFCLFDRDDHLADRPERDARQLQMLDAEWYADDRDEARNGNCHVPDSQPDARDLPLGVSMW